MMKKLIFLFVFFLFLQNSFAYDCNKFSGIDKDSCKELNSVDENLIANLFYKNTSKPDFDLVKNHNKKIQVTSPPNGVAFLNSGTIRDAWLSILTIDPSVKYQNTTYVPLKADYRAEYNYKIIPHSNYNNDRQIDGATCKITYSKNSESSSLNWFADGTYVGSGKSVQITSSNYNQVKAEASIQSTTKADEYTWYKYCCSRGRNGCRRYCYSCKYSSTSYLIDSISLQDFVSVQSYSHQPTADFTITNYYSNTYKGFLQKDNLTSITLRLSNSSFIANKFLYSVNFSKKPYDFIHIVAEDKESQAIRNIIVTNDEFYISNSQSCTIEYYDFFTKYAKPCKINLNQTQVGRSISPVQNSDLIFLLKMIVFIFILYIIYKLIKHYWSKALVPIALFVLLIPSALAEDCGITNLASCIPQKMYDFFLNLLNAPLAPLLDLVKGMLSSAPSITLFQGVWAIIIYCISLFYGILFVYSGFLFLFSGHDPIKREMAKEWLKNTVLMIVLVQASFYLYSLFLDMGSRMTSAVLSMVDPHFFMITADNLVNIGLEFLFILFYVLILIITLLFLTIRYLIVAFGVLFVPVGIFCYYIPPLRSYGKLIMHVLGMFIFVTFLDAIIILACSMLISIPLFQNIKILVMITCFAMIDILFILLIWHIIQKTGADDGAEKMAQAAKYIGMML